MKIYHKLCKCDNMKSSLDVLFYSQVLCWAIVLDASRVDYTVLCRIGRTSFLSACSERRGFQWVPLPGRCIAVNALAAPPPLANLLLHPPPGPDIACTANPVQFSNLQDNNL